jgi:hypothetical protein
MIATWGGTMTRLAERPPIMPKLTGFDFEN